MTAGRPRTSAARAKAGRKAARLATLGDWLGHAESLYVKSGAALGQTAADPHDEALYLLLRTLGLPLDSDAGVLGRILTAAERARVARALDRRLSDRIPAAYLTGEAHLGGCTFRVDERAIIPRSYFVEVIPRLRGKPPASPTSAPARGASRSCSPIVFPGPGSMPWSSRPGRSRWPPSTSAFTGSAAA
jgi:ribosomal protein L3 glutamine methyltransferase